MRDADVRGKRGDAVHHARFVAHAQTGETSQSEDLVILESSECFDQVLARSDPRRWPRAAILVALALAVLLSVRLGIADGLEYKNVSGVGLEHLTENIITDWYNWVPNQHFTVGVWMPRRPHR